MHETRRYRRYMLLLLMMVFASNNLDRIAIGLLLQDIKTDLHLSDTELGLLTGIAFAFFYALMGIPIARWADRGDRASIITIATLLWSAMLAASALVTNFAQLLLLRVGAGVGEAGCVPPSQSLIAGNYPRSERAYATAIYNLGAPISFVGGYFLAGWLNQFFGWRLTFIFLAAPGLVLALLCKLTLREPRRPFASSVALKDRTETLGGIVAIMLRNRTYFHLLIAFALIYFFGTGIQQWIPVFFIRSHGMQTGELGSGLAIAYGIGGLVGTYLGGTWAARYAASDERRQLLFVGCGVVLSGVLNALALTSPSIIVAFTLLTCSALAGCATYGPTYSVIQTVSLPHHRATAMAFLLFICNLIGTGLGPLAAGVLSDALRPTWGEESLRYTLIALCLAILWCAWHIWKAAQTVMEDIVADDAQAVDQR